MKGELVDIDNLIKNLIAIRDGNAGWINNYNKVRIYGELIAMDESERCRTTLVTSLEGSPLEGSND